jgi:phage terminase small subunit
MIPPPEWLTDPKARACFHRVQSRLLAMGRWNDIDASGLAALAAACGRYLGFASSIRALQNVEAYELARMQNTLEQTRLIARRYLAEFLMIPHDRVPLAAMSAEGLDADIADLCAPLEAA